MEKIFLIITSVMISALIGLVGYWLKTVHREFKRLIGELTDYTNQMRQLIVGIQMQIEKSIETDITELKEDVKSNTSRINKQTAQIAALNQRLHKQ